jgi:hypothetical protein
VEIERGVKTLPQAANWNGSVLVQPAGAALKAR